MNRKQFLSLTSLSIMGIITSAANTQGPEILHFADDGIIPNSPYPLLLYRNAFTARGDEGGDWLEQRFAANNWTNSWRWGIYDFHHYHSNTHEVLGVFSGSALLQLGGEKGKQVEVKAGDIIVIPAGVRHKNIRSEGLAVLGAYPNGMEPDLNKGEAGERPGTDKNIAAVPFPATDPFLGANDGLRKIWKDQ